MPGNRRLKRLRRDARERERERERAREFEESARDARLSNIFSPGLWARS